jgi:histidyl-tRNA synthetase
MSTKISAPKGFEDVLPSESWKWQAVEHTARATAERYHFKEIRTPVLESTELFHRGVGETTDIVRKETFTFKDRGDRSMTMRPEGTAGVVRAMIEHGLLNDAGARVKVFYIAPNFRAENVQAGRLRQHHQFGVEAFGIAEPEQDAECIALQMEFYARCGVRDLTLRLNSLGDAESKAKYRAALVDFFSPRAAQLSEDSRRRLADNPLRILDSKDTDDVKARQGAPAAAEYLSDASTKHFARVQELLKRFEIPFTVDTSLVRGLDYYTNTVWEVVAGGLGSQNSLGGGGRYDNLVEALGGRPTPGVGFGSGLERLLLALDAQGVKLAQDRTPLIYLVSQNDAAREANLSLLRELRAAGFSADMDPTGRSMKSQFKLSDREGATVVLVVGESELAANTVAMKQLATGQQQTIARGDLVETLRKTLTPALSPSTRRGGM